MAKKRRRAPGADLDPGAIIKVFKDAGRPMRQADVARALGVRKAGKGELKTLLRDLEREGRLIRTRQGMHGLPDQMRLVPGRLEIQRSGAGFVIPEDRRRRDIYVGHDRQGEAWHGDKVLVAVAPGSGERRPEGRIVRVLARGRDVLPCTAFKRLGRDLFLCAPTDPRLGFRVMARVAGPETRPDKGEIILVAPGERLEERLWEGRVLERLGPENDAGVQERLVKTSHCIPQSFPGAALDQARALPAHPSEADMQGRRDLRGLDLVTIDGAKARDFDDAVCVRRQGQGWRLWVAIADVSHYVPVGSAMDAEAYTRGNSYYFPQSVEPMFPPELSNGLCSLNPDTPRLCMTAEMVFDHQGRVVSETFYPAVMRSRARLTYGQVHRILEKRDQAERAAAAHVLPMLEEAEALARAINAERSARGSLDFDLPEPEIHFNVYGETTDIRPMARTFAHQIIEEFMIAANEAVARRLEAEAAPCLYRVHPAPDRDKLDQLFRLLSHTDLAQRLPAKADAHGLQALLSAARGTDLEFLVGRLTLRTMMQAKYQSANLGHFGLASDCYCHFTSPIRRYADLLVHRSLKAVLGVGAAPAATAVAKAGGHLSERERVAMDAEREILKRLTVLYLQDRVGEVFSGVVSSLADFGFWVELSEVLAEGLVRLSSMEDDYYGYLPERQEIIGRRTAKRYRLGQAVRVVLTDVVLSRQEINLALAEGQGREKGLSASP